MPPQLRPARKAVAERLLENPLQTRFQGGIARPFCQDGVGRVICPANETVQKNSAILRNWKAAVSAAWADELHVRTPSCESLSPAPRSAAGLGARASPINGLSRRRVRQAAEVRSWWFS